MEFLLLLWDELDDLTAACRHVVSSAAAEFSGLTAPLAAAGSGAAIWLLMPQFRIHAVILSLSAAGWSAWRRLS